MLVVRRDTGTREDESFRNLPRYLEAGDVIVVNNTVSVPARLGGGRDQLASRQWLN
jgi:S-adenosylmethionine:tRNA-ribosyltransferase-isomerase (queuine synthetase)